LAWSPKLSAAQASTQGDSKEKYFILTKNGLVEEQTFTEFKSFNCGVSACGHLCMSGLSNKVLHALPFFDSVFDYEALKVQFLEKPAA